jgi:hypothetical protein
MNRDERVVQMHLNALNRGKVTYEPYGTVPPDFSVGGRIAVEVRRLNQHFEDDGQSRSLEQDAIPLQQRFANLLAEFKAGSDQRTWFAMFNFRRPLPEWKHLRQRIRSALTGFLRAPVDDTWRIAITDRFSLTVLRASEFHDQTFIYGGHTDMDAGGWVVSEIITNLALYVPEKTRKVAEHRAKYPTWWLVFVDYIGTPDEQNEVRRHFKRPSEWDRIIVLNHNGKAYDV